jgi:hypothetical protein
MQLASKDVILAAIKASTTPIKRTEELPYSILLSLAKVAGEPHFKLASPTPLMIAQLSFDPAHFEPPPKNADELLKAYEAGRLIQYRPTFCDF